MTFEAGNQLASEVSRWGFWCKVFPFLSQFRRISEMPVFHNPESDYGKGFEKVNRIYME